MRVVLQNGPLECEIANGSSLGRVDPFSFLWLTTRFIITTWGGFVHTLFNLFYKDLKRKDLQI